MLRISVVRYPRYLGKYRDTTCDDTSIAKSRSHDTMKNTEGIVVSRYFVRRFLELPSSLLLVLL